jgi:hypothetical protein
MLPVRVSGGPGKEVPPERARTNQRKRELSAPAELPEENARACFETMDGISAYLVKTVPTCIAENETAEVYW